MPTLCFQFFSFVQLYEEQTEMWPQYFFFFSSTLVILRKKVNPVILGDFQKVFSWFLISLCPVEASTSFIVYVFINKVANGADDIKSSPLRNR